VGLFCGILSVLLNDVMDLNNDVVKFNHRFYLNLICHYFDISATTYTVYILIHVIRLSKHRLFQVYELTVRIKVKRPLFMPGLEVE
jgi:hypothetical protein